MSTQNQYYASDIAAKAVIELTNAIKGASNDAYAVALLADPRMTGNRGHLASCGISMRKVKQAKDVLAAGLPTLDSQKRAIEFLDKLDHEQGVFNG